MSEPTATPEREATREPAQPGSASSASQDASDFASMATEESPGLIAEFVQFLKEEKKWWLTPILVVLLLVVGLVFIGGSSLAPFIYALF